MKIRRNKKKNYHLEHLVSSLPEYKKTCPIHSIYITQSASHARSHSAPFLAKETPSPLKRMSLWTHLIELRRRLLYMIIFFMVAFIGSYIFSEYILNFLSKPLVTLFSGHRRFIYTSLSEAFLTYLSTALFGAAVLSCPFWTLQLWYFVVPALHSGEKRFYRGIFVMAPLFFIAGGIVAYYIVCPCAWKFFLSFESGHILSVPLQFEAKISEYIGITLKLMVIFGISFQLPVLLSLLVALGAVSLDTLKNKRKYAFLFITIFAAILTPPDLISPVGLILPMYGLYEGVMAWLSFHRMSV